MDLHALENLANKFATIGDDFEPYELEDDDRQRDFEHHMEDFLEDLKTMSWEELYKARKALEEIINEYLMDDLDPPYIVKKKMQLIEKQLGSIKTLAHKFAMKLGLESYPFSFEEDELNEYKKPEQSLIDPSPEPKSETYQPHMFNEYLRDLEMMDIPALEREKGSLKNQIQRYHMRELQVPLILDKKLGLVDQKLETFVSDPTTEALATEISTVNPSSNFDLTLEK